jgi:hypothetical protein
MIWRIVISAVDDEEGLVTDPPQRALQLEMVGSAVYLSHMDVEDSGKVIDKPRAEIKVPARSLLRALQALVEDSEAGLPEDLQRGLGV